VIDEDRSDIGIGAIDDAVYEPLRHCRRERFRPGLACASVLVAGDRDAERRVVLACAMPAAELMTSARVVRTKLLIAARSIADLLDNGELPGPVAL